MCSSDLNSHTQVMNLVHASIRQLKCAHPLVKSKKGLPRLQTDITSIFCLSKQLADICQIRLDFEIFELERPESTGVCLHDKFLIDGIDFKMPPLCGDLTGHHRESKRRMNECKPE